LTYITFLNTGGEPAAYGPHAARVTNLCGRR